MNCGLAEAGLYHVGARAYDPRTARWLQRDPIDAASGDPNLHRYCGGDPINFVDSDGVDQEQKQSASTAGENAQEKAEEKIAFICVGDTDIGLLGNAALAVRLRAELWAIRRALEQEGQTDLRS